MRLPARLNIAASLVAIAFVAACSDSTGLNQPTAAQVAAHFDSIAIQAQTQSQTNSAYSTRGFVASLIELAAATGATPTALTVTTASGTEQWKAYELLDHTGPGADVTDSSYILLMYRDADAHTAVLAEISSTGELPLVGLFTGDTILVSPTSSSGSSTLSSVGATCTAVSSSLLNPLLGTILFSSCNLARFQSSLSITLPATTGLDASLASIDFSTVAINGVRIVDQAQGSGLRVHDMLRAVAANRHH